MATTTVAVENTQNAHGNGQAEGKAKKSYKKRKVAPADAGTAVETGDAQVPLASTGSGEAAPRQYKRLLIKEMKEMIKEAGHKFSEGAQYLMGSKELVPTDKDFAKSVITLSIKLAKQRKLVIVKSEIVKFVLEAKGVSPAAIEQVYAAFSEKKNTTGDKSGSGDEANTSV